MAFKDFLFNTLPLYFHRSDTNKNIAGEGTLQRFLQVLGLELDDEIVPALENFIDELDAETATDDFLNYISDSLGNPPDVFLDQALYRKLLQFVINVYKIKGTKRSYELFYNILGYSLTITEIAPEVVRYYDDPTFLYDDGSTFYDMGCKTCSDYEILFVNIANPLNPLNQTTLNKLRSIIPFVEPINARLIGLIFGIQIVEDVNFCLEQEVKFTTFDNQSYDNPAYAYDQAGLAYDNINIQNTLTLPFSCAGSLPLTGISIWGISTTFEVQ